MLQVGRSRVRFPMRSLDFSIYVILPAALWPWPARKADNLTAICEPIIWEMRGHRRLTILWAFTACYRDSCLCCCLYIQYMSLETVFLYLQMHPWSGIQKSRFIYAWSLYMNRIKYVSNEISDSHSGGRELLAMYVTRRMDIKGLIT
jgi:hypothetical protein